VTGASYTKETTENMQYQSKAQLLTNFLFVSVQ